MLLKSACRPVVGAIAAMYAAELGSTSSPETSWFHGLSPGKILPLLTGGEPPSFMGEELPDEQAAKAVKVHPSSANGIFMVGQRTSVALHS
jgi:hypothetical protein